MGVFARNFIYGFKKYILVLIATLLILFSLTILTSYFGYKTLNEIIGNEDSKEQNKISSNSDSTEVIKMKNLCSDGCSPSTYIDYIISDNLLVCICTDEINNLNPQYDLDSKTWVRKKV